jgi:hypothetical protein
MTDEILQNLRKNAKPSKYLEFKNKRDRNKVFWSTLELLTLKSLYKRGFQAKEITIHILGKTYSQVMTKIKSLKKKQEL